MLAGQRRSLARRSVFTINRGSITLVLAWISAMGDGRWAMGDGRWATGDGRRERYSIIAVSSAVFDAPLSRGVTTLSTPLAYNRTGSATTRAR